MKCSHCGNQNRQIAQFCDQCGFSLGVPPLEAPTAQKLAGPSASSPEGRRAYLDSLDDSGRRSFPTQVDEAERGIAEVQAEMDDSAAARRTAQHRIRTERLAELAVDDPEARVEYTRCLRLIDHDEQLGRRYEAARSQLARLFGWQD